LERSAVKKDLQAIALKSAGSFFVDAENGAESIVVSLSPKEFEVIKDDFE
jgi:hypothetical protein